MVLPITAGGELHVPSKQARAKSLIMKAWRERWTEVQWGINIRQVQSLKELLIGILNSLYNCIILMLTNEFFGTAC